MYANFWIYLVMSAVFGFFAVGLVPIAFSYAGELGYPESQSVTSVLLGIGMDIWGIISIQVVQGIQNGIKNVRFTKRVVIN